MEIVETERDENLSKCNLRSIWPRAMVIKESYQVGGGEKEREVPRKK
jgi:hypothetical protein